MIRIGSLNMGDLEDREPERKAGHDREPGGLGEDQEAGALV